jgi:molybdate transport system permease protein
MLDPAERSALVMSLLVGGTGLLLVLPPGVFLGWLFARRRFRGRLLLEAVVFLPLVLPPVVTGYLLLILLGKHGWLGGAIHRLFGVDLVFTWVAMALAGGVVGLPLLVRTVRVAIGGVDPGLEDASRTLGVGGWGTFRRVTLPLAWPGIVAGSLLAFARALGEFGATVMVAPNVAGTRTLALEIYHQAAIPGGEGAVARLAVISVALSFGALLGTELLIRRGSRGRVGS